MAKPPARGGASGANTDGGESSAGGLRKRSAAVRSGPGGVLFAASGEALALDGYAFRRPTADAAAFVDGWDVQFTRLLVTVDTFASPRTPTRCRATNPNDGQASSPKWTDLGPSISRTAIRLSARQRRPGRRSRSDRCARDKNKNGARPSNEDGTRYAFGFDACPRPMRRQREPRRGRRSRTTQK